MTNQAIIDALLVVAQAIADRIWTMNSSDGTPFDDGDPDTTILVKQAQVYDYKLPPNHDTDPSPFILVRPMSGHDEQVAQNDTSRTLILVGGYSQDTAGYREVEWLIEAFRHELGTKKLSAAACGVRKSLDWVIYWQEADQPAPYWQAEIVVEYAVPGPEFHPLWSDD